MTEPPPYNEPIKPPNGNFSLEERKWREGITRAIKNMKIESLGDIGDVDLTSPSANQILKFDGTNWVNGSPSTTTVNWGDIAGILSDQTDLKNALDAKQDISGLAAVAFSGSYNDLTGTPTIPTVNNATLTLQKNGTTLDTFTANASSNVTVNFTVPTKTSDITNDSGFITLGDVPSLPSDTDLSHYNNTTSDFVSSSQLAAVATSGDYGDLLNTPTIPTVNDATLTIQKNSTTINTFTANASSNVTVDISVPTDTNDLTNNAGFITGISNLDDIGDVVITSAQDGQLLKYDANSGNWINGSGSTVTVSWNDITGKPTFATVATSGDYGDLLNTPTMGDLSSSSASYITVTGGTGAVIGSGASISFTDTNLAKLDGINIFTNKNSFLDIAIDTISTVSNIVSPYDYANSQSRIALYYNPPILGGNPVQWGWMGYLSSSDIGLFPLTSNTCELGSANNYWADIYATNLHFSGYNVIGDDPNSTGLFIGWRNSNNTGRYVRFDNDEVVPTSDNAIDLGTTTIGWRKSAFAEIFPNTTVGTLRQSGSQWYNDGLKIWTESATSRNWYIKAFVDLGGMPTLAPGNETIRLGGPSNRWREVFAVNGTIQTSDITKKDNIIKLDNALNTLNELKVYSYTWKETEIRNISYGIIAQEALEKAPEIVNVPENYKKGEGTLGVYVSNVLFMAVRAIQELSDKVKKLEGDDGNNIKDR